VKIVLTGQQTFPSWGSTLDGIPSEIVKESKEFFDHCGLYLNIPKYSKSLKIIVKMKIIFKKHGAFILF
jgi:hypothetical protein